MVCPRCGTVFCDDRAADSRPGRNVTPRRYCSDACKRASTPGWVDHQKRRRRRADVALRVCAVRRKRPYENAETALASAAQRWPGKTLSAYECACGFWHLTREADPAEPQADTPM